MSNQSKLARRLQLVFRPDPHAIGVRLSRPGPLCLPVCVKCGTESFPSADWDDFVIPMFANWLERLSAIAGLAEAVAHLHFMDGPYYVELVVNGHRCRVALGKRAVRTRTLRDVADVHWPALFGHVLTVAGRAEQALRGLRRDKADLMALRHALRLARRRWPRLG